MFYILRFWGLNGFFAYQTKEWKEFSQLIENDIKFRLKFVYKFYFLKFTKYYWVRLIMSRE